GDLYLKELHKKPKLIKKNINLRYVSSDLNKIMYKTDRDDLYVLLNCETNKLIAKKVSQSVLLERKKEEFKIFYTVEKSSKDFILLYDLYIYDEKNGSTLIAKNVDWGYKFKRNNNDELKVIYFVPSKKSNNGTLYILYEENHDVIEILDFPNDYEILNYDERVFIFAFQERGSLEIPLEGDFIGSLSYGDLFIYSENGELIHTISNILRDYVINETLTEILYVKNKSSKRKIKFSLCLKSLEQKNKEKVLYSEVDIDYVYNEEYRSLFQKQEDMKNQHKINLLLLKKHQFVKQPDISAPYKIYFTKKIGKTYYTALELAQYASEHIILDNLFEDDDSVNHLVTYTEDKFEDFMLMCHILNRGIFRNNDDPLGFSIYGVNIEDILISCETLMGHSQTSDLIKEAYQYNYNSFMTNDSNYQLHVEAVRDRLMSYYNLEYKKQLADKLYKDILKSVFEENLKSLHAYRKGLEVLPYEVLQRKKKEIQNKLILERKIPIRWKSELALFELIASHYPSAIMHYSPTWLQPQHIDVFVPELNVAFEYQGEQHFKPIDYFGGEEALKKRIHLDNRKKNLCTENGVILIEWLFNEPITKAMLSKKLKEVGLTI
ncbi:hypothetical protein DXK91_05245, partial [Parageobacillus toebii]